MNVAPSIPSSVLSVPPCEKMKARYYLQTHADLKPSLRRFNGPVGTPGERWDRDHWSRECASESACLLTNDRLLSDDETASFAEIKQSGVPIV